MAWLNKPTRRRHRGWEPNKKAPIYRTAKWERAREECLQRDKGKCVRCGKPGNIVDHIVRWKVGGAKYLLSNLQLLCTKCHNIKTKKEYTMSIDAEMTTFGLVPVYPLTWIPLKQHMEKWKINLRTR